MRYLIKLWDRKELNVSENVGQQVILAKENKIDCVKIRGALYETKAISYIEPIKEMPKENLLPETSDPVKKETVERVTRELAEKFKWA